MPPTGSDMTKPIVLKRHCAFVAALTAAMLAACSAAPPNSAISGVYILGFREGVLSQAGADLDLARRFDDVTLVLELTPDGGYMLRRLEDTRAALAAGTFRLGVREVSFGPASGEVHCATSGRYGWKIEHDALVLNRIADECDDRGYLFSALPWAFSALPFSMPRPVHPAP